MGGSSDRELNELRARVAALEAQIAQLQTTASPAQALDEVRQKLELALDATELGLWSWDMQTGVVLWDDRMRALHGLDEPLAPDAYAERLVHPDDRHVMQMAVGRTLASGTFQSHDFRIVRADGSVRWVMALGRTMRDETGAILKVVGGSLDVTRQHEMEAQLRGTQKMEALANLTAGVAHNFNNMLAVILPTLEFASNVVPSQHRRMLEDATHAATRAAELVQQLLTYTGQCPSQRRYATSVQELVENAISICRPAFAPEVKIQLDIDPHAPAIFCNAGQLEQVLVNLLLNARDALAEKHGDGGTIHVRTRTQRNAEGRALVQIEVHDDGGGLSHAARTHLFEPFFTTKAVGKGTGLGLATSFAIVRDHGGVLSCPAEPNGARFLIELPRCHDDAPLSAPRSEAIVPKGARVLVVDDDDAVRDTLAKVLGANGLDVLQADSGQSALELLHARDGVDVILLDRTMPGGSGERFIPRIRAQAPHARIVFLSGRGVEPELAAQVDAVVLKPARSAQLLEIIQRMMIN